MHEMSFVAGIINTVRKEYETNGLKSVRRIKISVGAMTGALPEYLDMYFREAAKDTFLDGAVLDITTVPVAARCSECGNIYEPERSNGYLCPVCRSGTGCVVRGKDIIVDAIICD